MNRYIAWTTAGLMTVLLLAACGTSGTSDTEKTATAQVSDANDAATVTAFAASTGQGSGSVGSASASTPTGNTGTSGIIPFATLPIGNSAAGPASTAVSTPRTTARGTAAAGSAVSGVNGTTGAYTDPQGRYSFTIPQGWQVSQSSDPTIDVQASPPSSLQGVLQVVSEDVSSTVSLDDYVNSTMSDLQSTVDNYQTVPNSMQTIKISGADARQFEFTGSQNGVNLKAAVFTVRQGNSAYVLLVAAVPQDFDQVLAQAQVSVNSFKFLQP